MRECANARVYVYSGEGRGLRLNAEVGTDALAESVAAVAPKQHHI